jgi:hypothetical protein
LIRANKGGNLTFYNVALDANAAATGLTCLGSSDVTVEDSTIYGGGASDGYSVYMTGASDVLIDQVNFYYMYNQSGAIGGQGAESNISITDCTAQDYNDAVDANNNPIDPDGWGMGRFLENGSSVGLIQNEYVALNATTSLGLSPYNTALRNTGEQINNEGSPDLSNSNPLLVGTNTVTVPAELVSGTIQSVPSNTSVVASVSSLNGAWPSTGELLDFTSGLLAGTIVAINSVTGTVGSANVTLGWATNFGTAPSNGDQIEVLSNLVAGTAGQNIVVTNGTGIGQLRTVTAVTGVNVAGTAAFQLTLSQPWTVAPNTSSQIEVTYDVSNSVFFGNTLSDQIGPNGAQNDNTGGTLGLQAATGLDVFSGGYGLVYDYNTASNLLSGVGIWNSGVDNPCDFINVDDNQINNMETGAFFAPPQGSNAPDFIGVTLESNTIDGAAPCSADPGQSGSGFILAETEPGHTQFTGPASLSIIEHNTVNNAPVGLTAYNDPDVLVYKNTFNAGTYSNGTGIVFTSNATTMLLSGNTYENVGTNYYSGTITPVLDTPYETYALTIPHGTSASLAILLSNDGASSLNWNGSSSTSWLTLQNFSGTISAESSADPLVNIGSLSAGSYSATLTFTVGSQVSTVVLLLTVV